MYPSSIALYAVLPLTREWIEISLFATGGQPGEVLPLTREWIEITKIIYLRKNY